MQAQKSLKVSKSFAFGYVDKLEGRSDLVIDGKKPFLIVNWKIKKRFHLLKLLRVLLQHLG